MIKKMLMTLPFLFLAHVPCEAGGKTLQEMMIQDLESVSYNMEIKYAPKEWKQEYLGWDLARATEEAKAKIYASNAQTPKEYQKIFVQFLKSTQDYHVGAGFYSTEFSIFPLMIQEQGGHFYIVGVEHDLEEFADFIYDFGQFERVNQLLRYEQSVQRLHIGDELIALNGSSMSEVMETLLNEQHGGDRTPTARALTVQSLFMRNGASGEETPNGTFEITVRHQGIAEPVSYTLPWFHCLEEIINKGSGKKTERKPLSKTASLIEKYSKKHFQVDYADQLLRNRFVKRMRKQAAQRYYSTTSFFDDREKGFLPPLGAILWETNRNNDFYAYLYQTAEGKKIGYLYLESFSYHDDAEDRINQLIKILLKLQRDSEALVLDITNNPGGNSLYAYAVLSLLTDTPMPLFTDREMLIQKDVHGAMQSLEWMALEDLFSFLHQEETLWGYTYSDSVKAGLVKYYNQIIESWNSGKTLTDELYLYGIEKIQPHPRVRYTKPILLLINELDFSCADFFPAVLQDSQRATLFGKKTAGAGGAVVDYEHSSRFGVMYYTLTSSIARRPNGALLENLGVSPDIEYDLTYRDIRENYADYVKAVNEAVLKIIRK